MIITNNMYMSKLYNVLNKNTKLSRDVRDGKLIKIKNGLYETNPNIPGYLLAGGIYGPSYLSFDFALSYYGMIPEKVTNYTSATFGKLKKKKYSNHFGNFTYRDVPKDVYPFGIDLIKEEDYYFQIATREKALCDKLYTLSPLPNMNELYNLIVNDLRIELESLKELDIELIEQIAGVYCSTNVSLLAKLLRRIINE